MVQRFVWLLFLLCQVEFPLALGRQPLLTLSEKRSVIFTCSLSGFNGQLHWLHSVQLTKRNAGGGVDVLVSADNSGPYVSEFLSQSDIKHWPSADVKSQSLDSWLKLIMMEFPSEMNGEYVCCVNYYEQEADRELSTWTTELSVHMTEGEVVSPQKKGGFTVEHTQGIIMSCESFEPSMDELYMVIQAEDNQISVSCRGSHLPCNESGLISFGVHHTRTGAVLEACRLDVHCGDETRFVCKSGMMSGNMAVSAPQPSPKHGCQTVEHAEDTSAHPKTLAMDGRDTDKQDSVNVWLIVGLCSGLLSLLLIVCVLVVVLVKRTKRWDYVPRNTSRLNDVEKGSMLVKKDSAEKTDNKINEASEGAQAYDKDSLIDFDRKSSSGSVQDISLHNIEDLGITMTSSASP